MRDDRERIFSRIRNALEELPTRTGRPEIDPGDLIVPHRLPEGELWEAFAGNLAKVRGLYCESPGSLVEFLEKEGAKVGYCDPALRDEVGDALAAQFEIRYVFSRETVDEIDFGITLGSGVIAESGTIILRDRETGNRLAALAPWIHVAAVRREAIFRSIGDALQELGDDPNTVWVTGPSKTADVEGILIEGVHGPGEQVCLRV